MQSARTLIYDRASDVSSVVFGLPLSAVLGSRLAREGFWTLVLKSANTLLAFVTTVLLARLLGAEGYGMYAYALALVTLLAMPAHAGLPNLVLRETARGMAEARPDHVRGVWRWAGRVVAGLSALVVVAAGPLLVIWQGGLSSPQGRTLAWALLLVPLIALGNLRGAALRGLQRIVEGQLPEFLLRPALFLLLVGGAAVFFRGHVSPPSAMALQAAASLGAFLAGAWLLWKATPPGVRGAGGTANSEGWLLSSTLFALLAGMSVVANQAATVLLGIFRTPEEVGVYRVASQLGTLAAFGLLAVNQVLAPRFADLYTRGRQKDLQRLVTAGARVMLAFNLILTILFVLLGPSFFRLVFGPEFSASYVPLLILLGGQVVNSAVGSAVMLLNMTGQERETVQGMVIGTSVNVILGLLLIPAWGTCGAAAATAVGMIVWKVLLWRRVRNVLGINSLAFAVAVGRHSER